MYDICIIGGGPAGYVGAIRAAQLGFTVALCEERDLGGTCLNRGCVPTKALMHASDAYRSLSAMASMGVCPGQASFDYAKIHAYKQATVDALRTGIQQLLQANKVQVIQARAQVLAPGKVQAGEEILEAKHILVATGSYPSIPPIPGAREDEDVCTSDALLEEPDRFYQRLIIIGGGVIGVEMASVYAGLGCQVTIIEALDRLLPMMDREISQNLSMILKKRGVQVYTGATVTGIVRGEGGLCCSFTTKKGEETALGDGVLISVGRRPNTNGLFAQGCAPAMERGFIQVDAGYQSSIPGIYGVGDCNGKLQLAQCGAFLRVYGPGDRLRGHHRRRGQGPGHPRPYGEICDERQRQDPDGAGGAQLHQAGVPWGEPCAPGGPAYVPPGHGYDRGAGLRGGERPDGGTAAGQPAAPSHLYGRGHRGGGGGLRPCHPCNARPEMIRPRPSPPWQQNG